jgi:hypothetical protein
VNCRFHIAATLSLSLGLIACGGNTTSAGSSPQPANPCQPVTAPGAPATAPGGIVMSAAPVVVNAGQTTQGIGIHVASASSSPPNVQSFGIGNTAFNTGDTIHRGQVAQVIFFGDGLSGAMTATVLGPPDVALSAPQSETGCSPDGSSCTSGVSFTATASATASLGARTVLLRDPSGGVTAFTGGLEVVP